jgi:hypothetical protein
MRGIRPFVREDLTAIMDLHARVFGPTQPISAHELAAYFEKIFFENPWLEEDLPSLVYEESIRIVGFLGIIPRPMLLGSRPIRLAVSNHFMVDPASRSTLVGIELMRAFFAGPQELSLAEGNNISRAIWEALGGLTSLLYSVHWTRPLRPVRYVMSQLRRRGLPTSLALAARPFCRLLDGVATRIPQSPFHPVPQAPEEDLTVETLLHCLSSLSKSYTLYPCYDRRSLEWLLDVLRQKNKHGQFRKAVIRKADGVVAGWYLYYANTGGMSEVLQIGAKADSVKLVLDNLIYHAWRQGAIALTGRIEPRFMQELSDR